MLDRRALLVLPALALACSSSSSDTSTHGMVFDASSDLAMDEPPDGSPEASMDGSVDGSPDAGHPSDAGHDTKTPDAPGDAPLDSSKPSDGSSCKGTIAIAGGTGSVGFGATSVNGGAWKLTSLSSTSASANPTLVPFGGGFMAVFTAAGTNYLQYSAYTASGWSTASNASGATCIGPAAALGAAGLAGIGTTLHSVYLGTDNDFFHGTYTTALGWDCESDPLTPSGGSQSFGPSAPALASFGSSIIAVFDGSDGGLYTQTWTAGAWAAAAAIVGAGVGTSGPFVPPSIVALTGGSSDLMVVYQDNATTAIYWATETSGVWSTPQVTIATAYTAVPLSLAPLAGGGAVVTFEGTDSNPYAMTFDPTGSTWSSPVALTSGSIGLGAPPTVATGICGADAIAAYVQPAGVELVSLSSGTWSSPTLVSATASMTYATLATSP